MIARHRAPAALALGLLLTACQSLLATPGASGPVTEPTVSRVVPGAGRKAPTPGLQFRRATPSAAISTTERLVDLPPGTDVRPGAWSPSGRYLLAHLIRRIGALGPVGRLITVDAEAAAPLWDSGDVEAPLSGPTVAGWLADERLILARQDGALVLPDGTRQEEEPWIQDQPLALALSPDGRQVLVLAADSAWLVEGPVAQRIAGWQGLASSWAWRADGRALVIVGADGRIVLVDVPSAAGRQILAAASALPLGELTAPVWLADGRLLLTEARRLTVDGRPLAAHLVLDIEGGTVRTLHSLLRVTPEETAAVSLAGRVSPDGRWVLVPLTERARAEPATNLLFEVSSGGAKRVSGLVEPAWAPTSDRIAFLANGQLAVWPVTAGEAWLLTAQSGISHHSWSPDGRWLTYRDQDKAVWLIASDGSTLPCELANQANGAEPPTWSPAGQLLAAAVMTADGEAAVPALALYRFEVVPISPDARSGD